MPLASDVVLIGTGVAPLVAAARLISQDKSVLLLNPDWDFFLEDSELPLDPLLGDPLDSHRLSKSWPERVLAELRPEFPGAVEFWNDSKTPGYRDLEAPHVRQRNRIWFAPERSPETPGPAELTFERLEELYVETSDTGFNPQILEGLAAAKKFPGFNGKESSRRALMIPKLCDVDVSRYRNGLLEFVRERLGPDQLISNASQIETIPEGIRFHARGGPRTARANDGVLVFWTPRLTQWVLQQSKKFEIQPRRPLGVRLWEEWTIVSREFLDPTCIGVFDEMVAWADVEGSPQDKTLQRLNVLKSGPRIHADELNSPSGGMSWSSVESLSALANLCQTFMSWDRFSIRSMKPKAIFEWADSEPAPWVLNQMNPTIQIVPGSDGPLSEVVRSARQACERFAT